MPRHCHHPWFSLTLSWSHFFFFRSKMESLLSEWVIELDHFACTDLPSCEWYRQGLGEDGIWRDSFRWCGSLCVQLRLLPFSPVCWAARDQVSLCTCPSFPDHCRRDPDAVCGVPSRGTRILELVCVFEASCLFIWQSKDLEIDLCFMGCVWTPPACLCSSVIESLCHERIL